MASCAICQRAITRAQKFVLLESAEVAHTSCYQTGRPTIGQRRAVAISQQTARTASLQSEVTTLAIDLERAQDKAERAEREAEEHRRENRMLQRELSQLRTDLQGAQRLATRMRDERDAARREAALHQQLGAASASPDHDPGQPRQPQEDTRDDTEIRMSLLDLA